VSDVLDHVLGQENAEERAPLGGTRGAEAAPLAREGDEVLGAALGAADPGEAAVEEAAVEKAVDRVLDAATPEAEAALEVLLPAPLDLVVEGVDEPIQRRVSRPARAIEGTTRRGQKRVLLPSMTRTRDSNWQERAFSRARPRSISS
jgi:hypothetical protein